MIGGMQGLNGYLHGGLVGARGGIEQLQNGPGEQYKPYAGGQAYKQGGFKAQGGRAAYFTSVFLSARLARGTTMPLSTPYMLFIWGSE